MCECRRRVRRTDERCGRDATGSAARGLAIQQPISGDVRQSAAARLRHRSRYVTTVPAQQEP